MSLTSSGFRRADSRLISFAEHCLRQYHFNCAEIKNREEFIRSLDYKSPSDIRDILTQGGDNLSSVERTVDRLLEDETLIRLKKRTEPVAVLLNTITEQEKRFIDMRYFKGMEWKDVASELSISISTARLGWRERIITKLARLIFGYIV